MKTSVRVVVANRPRLLRELVLSTLSGQEGISVVGETENEQDVPSLVAATKPDFLLIALDEPQRRPALCCCRSFLRCGLLQKTENFLLGFVPHPFEDDGGERGGVARGDAE